MTSFNPSSLDKLSARLDAAHVRRSELLAPYTTFRIGGPADLYYEATSADALANAVREARALDVPYFVLGLGANILVGDRGFRGLVIRNTARRHEFRERGDQCDLWTESGATVKELIQLSQRLLESIVSADWETYRTLCDASLSAFEPESSGHLVEGLGFHEFYFGLGAGQGPVRITLASPHVRVMGDVAVVSYVRLTQRCDADGKPVVSRCEETRVWQRVERQWRHVHFHRSVTR